MATKGTRAKARPHARWYELVEECPLIPIRSEAEADRAQAMLDRLIDREDLTRDEEDYLHALGDLVADYEDETIPEPEVSPAAMLRHLLDSRGVSQKEAAEGSGLSEATLSQILTGRRAPSRRAIQALSAYFRVDPGVFL